MAKKAKLNITTPTQPKLATAAKNEDAWQVKDDADKIKRYAELRGNPSRHKAAIGHIMSEHENIRNLASDYDADEAPATTRKTTRKTTRSGSRK